jgi:hypothetical protein
MPSLIMLLDGVHVVEDSSTGLITHLNACHWAQNCSDLVFHSGPELKPLGPNDAAHFCVLSGPAPPPLSAAAKPHSPWRILASAEFSPAVRQGCRVAAPLGLGGSLAGQPWEAWDPVVGLLGVTRKIRMIPLTRESS